MHLITIRVQFDKNDIDNKKLITMTSWIQSFIFRGSIRVSESQYLPQNGNRED